jgi:AcrR family transcriptional regulator
MSTTTPSPTPTRQRLVEAAGRRFYRDGFRMVGLDQILAEVGISKTAFYKHFESKEDLVLEVLIEHDREMLDTFRSMIRDRGGPTPRGQLHTLMDVVEHFIESGDFQGCIFVNVAMEFPLPHEPAHIAAASSKRAVEQIVCELAVAADAADPRALAKELCLIMEGAYVTRHVTGDRETVCIARKLADLAIAANCPSA